MIQKFDSELYTVNYNHEVVWTHRKRNHRKTFWIH